MHDEFINRLAQHFSGFADKLRNNPKFFPDDVGPPATKEEVDQLEVDLGLPLPESYKTLLRCGREFRLLGDTIHFGWQHPFVYDFDPWERLAPHQQKSVKRKGCAWPPPSQGMICFSECWLEADGDQILFDCSRGLVNGEYPIMYYAPEAHPPEIRFWCDNFTEFMNGFLDDPVFADESQ